MKRSRRILAYSAAVAAALSLSGCSVTEQIRAILEQNHFDPEENIVEDVYGPPIDLDWDYEEDDEFDPEDNIPEVVYGPPEMFGLDPVDPVDGD